MDPEEFRKQLKKWAIIASFFVLGLVLYSLGWRRLLIVYVMIVGVLSVAAILIQSGRGGGLAASLGGVGGDSLFGARSATPIARATYVMLALFIFICMLIARLPMSRPAGLVAPAPLGRAQPVAPAEAPALPDSALPDSSDIELTPPGEPAQDD